MNPTDRLMRWVANNPKKFFAICIAAITVPSLIELLIKVL